MDFLSFSFSFLFLILLKSSQQSGDYIALVMLRLEQHFYCYFLMKFPPCFVIAVTETGRNNKTNSAEFCLNISYVFSPTSTFKTPHQIGIRSRQRIRKVLNLSTWCQNFSNKGVQTFEYSSFMVECKSLNMSVFLLSKHPQKMLHTTTYP